MHPRRADLLGYSRVADDRKTEEQAPGPRLQATGQLPEAPRLPERAAIYIAPDGTVHFGALFEGLLPVVDALKARK